MHGPWQKHITVNWVCHDTGVSSRLCVDTGCVMYTPVTDVSSRLCVDTGCVMYTPVTDDVSSRH